MNFYEANAAFIALNWLNRFISLETRGTSDVVVVRCVDDRTLIVFAKLNVKFNSVLQILFWFTQQIQIGTRCIQSHRWHTMFRYTKWSTGHCNPHTRLNSIVVLPLKVVNPFHFVKFSNFRILTCSNGNNTDRHFQFLECIQKWRNSHAKKYWFGFDQWPHTNILVSLIVVVAAIVCCLAALEWQKRIDLELFLGTIWSHNEWLRVCVIDLK